jgi:hypothetical protein
MCVFVRAGLKEFALHRLLVSQLLTRKSAVLLVVCEQLVLFLPPLDQPLFERLLFARQFCDRVTTDVHVDLELLDAVQKEEEVWRGTRVCNRQVCGQLGATHQHRYK